MKKSLFGVFFLLMFMVTGCFGSKKEQIVCTLELENEDVGYTMTAELKGNIDGEVIVGDELVTKMTFETEEWAKSSYDALKADESFKGVDIKRKGKVITIKESEKYEEAISKKEFIDSYTLEGYTCKE